MTVVKFIVKDSTISEEKYDSNVRDYILSLQIQKQEACYKSWQWERAIFAKKDEHLMTFYYFVRRTFFS